MFKWIILSLSICSVFVFFTFLYLQSYSDGKGKQKDINKIIFDASMIYLQSQYVIIWSASLFVFFILWYIFGFNISLHFGLGVLTSSLVGFIGMFISVKNNVKVVEQCSLQVIDDNCNTCFCRKIIPMKNCFSPLCNSSNSGYKVAFLSGSVIGNMVCIIGLISIMFLWNEINILFFSFGSCFVSLLGRLGGGIFTKGADVGADLVGKLELNLPEDDARNPAVIADNVGDNVGDCYGTLLDTFDSYVLAIGFSFALSCDSYKILLIPTIGILSNLLPIIFMKFKFDDDGSIIEKEMNRYSISVMILFMCINGIFCKLAFVNFNEWLCSSIGIIITFILMRITEYYTSYNYEPVKSIVESSKYGHGTNVISGISVGLQSVLLPIITICIGLLSVSYIYGFSGIAYCVVGMASLLGSVLTLDMIGPISDNAGGIAEMSGLESNVRKYTDQLDAIGNTTKAVTKGYSIGIAILVSTLFLYKYSFELSLLNNIISIQFGDPIVIVGLLMGVICTFFFASLANNAVRLAAISVMDDVRDQLLNKNNNNSNELDKNDETKNDETKNEYEPDYNRTIIKLTIAAFKQMILPAILPFFIIMISIFLGYIYYNLLASSTITNYNSIEGVVGSLLLVNTVFVGVLLGGSVLSIFLTISGGAWDNTKKYLEVFNKGSEQHKASITGDTVGDPFKDTSGPSMNALIKITSIISIITIFIIRIYLFYNLK